MERHRGEAALRRVATLLRRRVQSLIPIEGILTPCLRVRDIEQLVVLLVTPHRSSHSFQSNSIVQLADQRQRNLVGIHIRECAT